MIKQVLIPCLVLIASILPFACAGGGTSGRQQTCSNSGDCKDGLLCVNEVCVQNDYPVAATAKECVRIDCDADADCCSDFEPNPACANFQEECDAGTDPGFGLDYCELAQGPNCVCQLMCREAQCVLRPTLCTSDTNCNSSAAPVCNTTSGQCVQCLTNDDCDVEDGESCNAGSCDAACEINEDCPYFHACTAGECVEVGCEDARDCILYMRRADAVCKAVEGQSLKTCSVPCEENAECPNLHVCENGECAFLGCDNDEQCRPVLGLDHTDQSTPKRRAACLPIDR